jgi:hypothetical protein
MGFSRGPTRPNHPALKGRRGPTARAGLSPARQDPKALAAMIGFAIGASLALGVWWVSQAGAQAGQTQAGPNTGGAKDVAHR